MITRNEINKLKLNSLDLQIFLDDLFLECKNEYEVEWLRSELIQHVDCASDERVENMEGERGLI